jgi:hypothetical protein
LYGTCTPPPGYFVLGTKLLAASTYESLEKTKICLNERFGGIIGTVVAKERNRTRRVDKGKSGQALKTAVSGGFGGGILSQLLKQVFDSFGGTEWHL